MIAPAYKIGEKLYESANIIVYRAKEEIDNKPVILKMLKETYPPPEKIELFKREYEITERLHDISGVVNTYGMETRDNLFSIMLEDFGGHSLDALDIKGKILLNKFLELSIEITSILGKLHSRNVIHKDINPSNILMNPETGDVKLIDFGISTVLSRENSTFCTPNLLEGTLAYLSPEQTGRMNRSIDYRSDFYSLGITFYELLIGSLPFVVSDPLEIIHSHIAKKTADKHYFKIRYPSNCLKHCA